MKTNKTDTALGELVGYASSLQLGYLSAHLQELLHQAQVDNPTYLEFCVKSK